jgi:hypothetical protein
MRRAGGVAAADHFLRAERFRQAEDVAGIVRAAETVENNRYLRGGLMRFTLI